MSRPLLAVSRRIAPAMLERLSLDGFDLRMNAEVVPLGERLAAFIGRADAALLVPYDKVDAALLAQCPQLKVVANSSAGYDNLDLVACSARGVACTNAPDGVTNSTADFAMGLLIAAARRITAADAHVRQGRWGGSTYDEFMSPSVSSTTLGILGMGRLGQAVAHRAAHGFGMTVGYWSRTRMEPEVEARLKCTYWGRQEVFARADHVLSTLPLDTSTRHCIGAAQFASMKRGATFVNIGRGGVVDESALAAALHEGRLGAAALDVFEGEPRVSSTLLDAPRLIMTPHVASATVTARVSTLAQALDNVSKVLQGQRPPNLLNVDVRLD